MGLGLFSGSKDWPCGGSDDSPCFPLNYNAVLNEVETLRKRAAINPDPRNWKFRRGIEIGKYVVIEVVYPNCTNFDGHKVMVYHGTSMRDLLERRELDPHFSDDNSSPIARFRPDKEGWEQAIAFAEMNTQTMIPIDFVEEDS